jgi:hypothetical protein
MGSPLDIDHTRFLPSIHLLTVRRTTNNSVEPIARRTQTTTLLSMRYSHAEPSLIDMVVNLLERSDEAWVAQFLGNTLQAAVNNSKPEATHISAAVMRDSTNTSQHVTSFEDLLAEQWKEN